jgi:hypothetical protein
VKAAIAPESVRVPRAGGRCVPENTLKLPGANWPSMTARAGSSVYSVPLAAIPTPVAPTQLGMPVRDFSSVRICSACGASGSVR